MKEKRHPISPPLQIIDTFQTQLRHFYFHENEAGLDKEIKHLELKRETCLKQFPWETEHKQNFYYRMSFD